MSSSKEIELTQWEIDNRQILFNGITATSIDEAIEIITGRLLSLKKQLPADFKVEIVRLDCPIYLF